MSTPPFDEIALEFARHHANIDYARREYDRQRDRLLAGLERSLTDALTRAGLPLESIIVEADKTHRTAPLDRHYHRAVTTRLGTNERKRDGVWFGLSTGAVRGEDDPELCFRADVYFRMGPPAYGKLAATLHEVETHSREHFEGTPLADDPSHLRYVSGWLYIPIARIPATADAFTGDRFEFIVTALPERFIHYDDLLGNAYAEAWNLATVTA